MLCTKACKAEGFGALTDLEVGQVADLQSPQAPRQAHHGAVHDVTGIRVIDQR